MTTQLQCRAARALVVPTRQTPALAGGADAAAIEAFDGKTGNFGSQRSGKLKPTLESGDALPVADNDARSGFRRRFRKPDVPRNALLEGGIVALEDAP